MAATEDKTQTPIVAVVEPEEFEAAEEHDEDGFWANAVAYGDAMTAAGKISF